MMRDLLEFEADRRAISIMMNSFGTALNDPFRRDERSSLFASFGHLYPEGIEKFSTVSLQRTLPASVPSPLCVVALVCQVGDMSQLGAVLEDYKDYSRLWQRAQNEGKHHCVMPKLLE